MAWVVEGAGWLFWGCSIEVCDFRSGEQMELTSEGEWWLQQMELMTWVWMKLGWSHLLLPKMMPELKEVDWDDEKPLQE